MTHAVELQPVQVANGMFAVPIALRCGAETVFAARVLLYPVVVRVTYHDESRVGLGPRPRAPKPRRREPWRRR